MYQKWQKICDGSDWFDPSFTNTIRESLFSTVHLHRKQWEFAVIFKVLEEAGKLNEQSTGIAFGAGKERLLYGVTRHVKKLIATDLYNTESKWEGTKTNDPRTYLLAHAPFEIDPEKLDAKYMNMREITYPDESFDFAYSSCVFEHISNDDAGFVEHLLEVKRTLKEGGLYVFTTEMIYGHQTARVPGSHFFELNHLFDLIEQSGLHAAPEFNAQLNEISINKPAPLADDMGFNSAKTWIPHITCLRQGLVFTSCAIIVHKDSSTQPVRPKITGYERSRHYVNANKEKILSAMWRDWQTVSVTRGNTDRPSIIGHEHFQVDTDRSDDHLAFHSPHLQIGTGTLTAQVTLIPADNQSIKIKLISCSVYGGHDVRLEDHVVHTSVIDQGSIIHLNCQSDAERIYAVLGRGRGTFKFIDLKFKKSNDEA